jgi:hypothetical protein
MFINKTQTETTITFSSDDNISLKIINGIDSDGVIENDELQIIINQAPSLEQVLKGLKKQ